jgi:phenylalanyl-tRNA synthetase beta chain
MTIVKFPRKEFEKHVKLTKEVEEKIPMLGTPLESLTKEEVEIEVFPNRPDLISMQGYLRALKAFIGKEKGLKKYQIKKSGYKLLVENSLPPEWPYAVACIVKGVKFDDSKIKEVIDIQEKLGFTVMRDRKKGGIGLYPLEKVQFPIKFVGMDPNKIKFRPLEFPSEITGRQILSKHPTGKEYSHICQEWKKLPVFIDSKKRIMSMPPIINSHDLGKIDETTRDVFIEATGTDLRTLQKVLTIIATSLADMGGQIYSIECVQQNKKIVNAPDLTPEKMKISLENINKLIGLDLKESDLEKLLPKMGYDYKSGIVSIPPYRADILHEVDIAEDVAIAYGYDKLVPEIPKVATIGEESRESKLKSKISEILVGLGLTEISSYHLIKAEEAKLSKLKEKIELEDSKTDYKILRPNLLIPALRILSENKDNDYPQKVFEIGTVFSIDKKNKTETGIAESDNLLIASSPGNFTEIKQTLDYLSKILSLDLKIQESTKTGLIDGRTATISLDGKEIGYLGELHPETLSAWNIKMPISLLEISLDGIFKKL